MLKNKFTLIINCTISIVILTGALYGIIFLIQTSGPKVSVSDLNFGVVEPGQEAQGVFCVENEGTAVLKIYELKTCCGVNLPFGFPKEVNPKSKVFISVRVGIPSNGDKFRKTLTLKTNDSQHQELTISINATIDPSFQVTPERIDIGYSLAGSSFQEVARVSLPDNNKSISIIGSTPNLSAIIRKDLINKQYIIDISISELISRGPLKEYLYIKTEIPSRPNIIIPIVGMIEKGISSRPNSIYFGIIENDKPITRSISLRIISPDWEKPQIEPLREAFLTATLHKESAKIIKLNVFVDPVKAPSKIKSFIILRSSNGDILQLPILGFRTKS